MSSLEALLQPATAMINRQIRAKTPARELCAKLADRVMAVRVSNTALTIYLLAEDNQVLLSTAYEEEPDVVVSGSMLSLAQMAGSAGDSDVGRGDIKLSGDALVAEDFQKLLRYGKPNIEEELAGVVGDVAAHGIGEFIRGVNRWSRAARSTMQQNVGEYLQEESRSVPTRDEVVAFQTEVDTLRDDVARFEARLRTIESAAGTQDNI